VGAVLGVDGLEVLEPPAVEADDNAGFELRG
jgi:hypothetical protein